MDIPTQELLSKIEYLAGQTKILKGKVEYLERLLEINTDNLEEKIKTLQNAISNQAKKG